MWKIPCERNFLNYGVNLVVLSKLITIITKDNDNAVSIQACGNQSYIYVKSVEMSYRITAKALALHINCN